MRGFEKTCYRFLDEPVRMLGLEPEDIISIVAVFLAIFIIAGIMPAAVVLVALFILLRIIKKGKPAGYLNWLLYKTGIVAYLPASFVGYYIIKPLWKPATKNKNIRLSPFPGSSSPNSLHKFYYPQFLPGEQDE